jgi:hypothetical protein
MAGAAHRHSYSVAQFISTIANLLKTTGYRRRTCAKVWNRQAFGSVLRGAVQESKGTLLPAA